MQRLSLLTSEEISMVHNATLQILQTVGISASSESFKTLLSDNGCLVEKGRIKMPPGVVDTFLKKTPYKFSLHGRGDHPALQMGEQNAYTQVISGTPHIIDLYNGQRRDYLLQDITAMTRLANKLPNIDIVSCGVPRDSDGSMYMLIEIAAMLMNTTKPIRLPLESLTELDHIYELIALVAGGLEQFRNNPFLYLEVSPLSPLDYAAMPADTLVNLAEKGIPLGIIPCNMMGVTGPMTLIGSVAQQNAEVVAGVVAAQMVNPGTPVIMSPRVTFIDMKTGIGQWAAPETGLAAACSAQLAMHYRLPVSVSGFSVAAKLPDQQSGYERCFNALCAAMTGCDIIAAAGSLDNALTSCYAQLVLDNEITSLTRRILRNIEVSEETLATEVISRVVEDGSSFLSHKHTKKHLRAGELWQPFVGDRSSFTDWIKSQETIEQKARRTAQNLLSAEDAPLFENAVANEINRIIESAKKTALK